MTPDKDSCLGSHLWLCRFRAACPATSILKINNQGWVPNCCIRFADWENLRPVEAAALGCPGERSSAAEADTSFGKLR